MATKKEEKYELDGREFVYHTDSGDTIRVEQAQYLINGGMIRKFRNDEQGLVFSILEDKVDKDQLEKIDALGIDEWTDFIKTWQTVGAVDPGK